LLYSQLEQFDLEIRALAGSEKIRWGNKMKSYQAELKRILAELNAPIRSYADEDNATELNVPSDQKQRLLNHMDKNEASTRALNNGYLAVCESEELGAKILADLDGQRQTIGQSHRKVLDYF
jgi:vesicle transport through interaction with t-SNAREs protein 1